MGDITKVTAIAAGYNQSFASRHDGHLPPLVQNRGRSGNLLLTLPTLLHPSGLLVVFVSPLVESTTIILIFRKSCS